MSHRKEYEALYLASLVFANGILIAHIYYYCRPALSGLGLVHPVMDYLISRFRSAGAFSSPLPSKAAALALMALSTVIRTGKGKKTDVRFIAALSVLSVVLYFLPWYGPLSYLLTTMVGFSGSVLSASLAGRLYGGIRPHDNDMLESFAQEEQRHDTEFSVNIPMEYYWKKRWHDGWISVVNPFRGTLIMGLPGCGKSFSLFHPYIRQFISKGFTMMLYDYKMPDLSTVVYNELLKHLDAYDVKPRFCCIDFRDPRRSCRCNPISPRYLSDIVDASETARVVMTALNRGNERKDFFTDSAQQYFGICLWQLATYTPPGGKKGDWCDIPHLIELINQDYRKVLSIIRRNPDLGGKAKLFIDALEAGAQDQLQGQIASVRVPLNDIASPVLYWVLSGDDFSLDINDPASPKIVCLGNDPKRQEVYGMALSLYTFRIIKLVNEKGRLPCALLMDELPTISVEGLDGLMATARSNRVAVVLGIQDLSQLVAGYGDKVADKIRGLPANVFIGQVNGKTAECYSKEFGREFRRQESETVSIDSESTSISYHEEEVMPVRKIATLPAGTFFGKVAVDHGTRMKQNFFCARIKASEGAAHLRPVPQMTDFHLETVSKALEDERFSSAMLRSLVRGRLLDEVESGSFDPPGREFPSRPLTDEEVEAETLRRVGLLGADERMALIAEVRRRLEDEKIRTVMEDNARRIRRDVASMVERESSDDDTCFEEDYEYIQ